MSLSPTITATVTREVKLTTTLKKRYLTQLKAYAELKAQKDAIEHAMKATRAHVEDILTESGEESLAVDGYKTTLVAPVTKRLDPQMLITLGVSPDIIKQATLETAGTPYLRITVPGSRNDE